MNDHRLALAADLAVKVALLLLVIFVAVQRDQPEYEGRTMTARLALYPLMTLFVPAAYLLVRTIVRRPLPYPYALDILVVLPFLIDMFGAALDLNDSLRPWDEVTHLASWALLAGAFGWLTLRLGAGPLEAAGLAVGFGATIAIVWEVLEYVTIHQGGIERQTEYGGTIRDLSLALAGSLAAAVAVAGLGLRRSEREFS